MVLDAAETRWLLAHPETEVTVDLEQQYVEFEGHRTQFDIEPFARHCLMNGVDPLGFLLDHDAEISAHEEQAA